jgi:hypothetical protein
VLTARLYGRYPLHFLALAAAVIVPYDLVVLAASNVGPLGHTHTRASAEAVLLIVELALVTPLVSALNAHAIALIGAGRAPRPTDVIASAVRVLPVAAAASIMSGLGIGVGLFLFVFPGIYLMLRWVVAAQAAAIENDGWIGAIRRSQQLSAGRLLHILAVLIVVFVVIGAPSTALAGALGGRDTHAVAFAAGVALHCLTASIAALVTALLYYDLSARAEPT